MKPTHLFVIACHLLLLFGFFRFTPPPKPEKKPLHVKTIVQKPAPAPPPAPLPPPPTPHTSVAAARPIKKAAPVKKPQMPQKSGPQIPDHLVRQLQESIAKIDESSHKLSPSNNLTTPKVISTLTSEHRVSNEDASQFAKELVACLQRNLVLPEVGEVKVELLLQKNGTLKEFRILSSRSKRNQSLLEETLGKIRYPSFTGSLKNEMEHSFVIAFYNS